MDFTSPQPRGRDQTDLQDHRHRTDGGGGRLHGSQESALWAADVFLGTPQPALSPSSSDRAFGTLKSFFVSESGRLHSPDFNAKAALVHNRLVSLIDSHDGWATFLLQVCTKPSRHISINTLHEYVLINK